MLVPPGATVTIEKPGVYPVSGMVTRLVKDPSGCENCIWLKQGPSGITSCFEVSSDTVVTYFEFETLDLPFDSPSLPSSGAVGASKTSETVSWLPENPEQSIGPLSPYSELAAIVIFTPAAIKKPVLLFKVKETAFVPQCCDWEITTVDKIAYGHTSSEFLITMKDEKLPIRINAGSSPYVVYPHGSLDESNSKG